MSAADRELESEVEKPAREYARQQGWWACKFVSPGMRGVPDDVFIRDGLVLFVEFKRPGELPRPQQVKRIREMEKHGAQVRVIDTLADAYFIFR